jgi:hypothetical protein
MEKLAGRIILDDEAIASSGATQVYGFLEIYTGMLAAYNAS